MHRLKSSECGLKYSLVVFFLNLPFFILRIRGVQWNSPKNAAKPGSTGWSPQPMAATTGAGYRPMVCQKCLIKTPFVTTIYNSPFNRAFTIHTINGYMYMGMGNFLFFLCCSVYYYHYYTIRHSQRNER